MLSGINQSSINRKSDNTAQKKYSINLQFIHLPKN